MKDNTSRINTRVDKNIKIRWEHFLLAHHHTVRVGYGPELGRAMELYMNQFSNVTSDDIQHMKMNKTTRNVLRLISIAFRNLPTYPAVAPIVVNAVIKDNIIHKDHRTFNRYLRLVIDHLKPHVSEDGVEKKSVQGFCEYVDRLLNENSLK